MDGGILATLSPMTIFWLAALIIFGVAEGLTVALVSLWFCGGSLAALIVAALGGPLWLQILLFLAVSAVLLALLRPLIRKSSPRKTPTNADRHIGRDALVTEEIDNLRESGAIKLDGVTWTARSESGEVIPEGTLITVRRLTGAKAWVVPAKE